MSNKADQGPPAQQASGSAGSLTTARALIFLQLLSRMLTFGLNQALVRLAPPEVFGTAAIQFDLICSSILFLSREGVRSALLRGRSSEHGSETVQGPTAHGQTGTAGKASIGKGDQGMGIRQRQDARLAALPLCQGLLISTLLTAIYILRTPASTAAQRDFHPSLALYILSALLELNIEPLYIRALKSDPPRIKVRVQAEGGMAIVRAVVTVGSLLLLGRYERISMRAPRGHGGGTTGQRALLAFALGQLGGAVWLAGRYIWAFGLPELSLGKGKSSEARFDPQTLSLTIANSKQSFIKHALTEADRLAVAIIYPLENQGGYAVAMNYGSLIARILFQPIEETLFLHFSSKPSPHLLSTAVRISLHLPLLLYTFLPPLLPFVLPILLPPRYLSTDTPAILQVYLQAYIPLLSLNGLLEAYHSATATPAQVGRQMGYMIAGSAAFAGVLAVLGRVEYKGEEGLIYASCAAMLVRIGYAYAHARGTAGEGMRAGRLMPSGKAVGMMVVAGGLLRETGKRGIGGDVDGWRGRLVMIGAGGVLGLMSVGVIGWSEWKRWKRIRA